MFQTQGKVELAPESARTVVMPGASLSCMSHTCFLCLPLVSVPSLSSDRLSLLLA